MRMSTVDVELDVNVERFVLIDLVDVAGFSHDCYITIIFTLDLLEITQKM